jgi:hypothetical protein
MKSQVTQSSFKSTLAGALLLKASAYAGLKRDRKAWVGSVLVLAAVALSHGFGAVLRAPSQGYSESAVFTFLFGFVGEILLWLGTSVSIFAGVRGLSTQRISFGELAWALGFAAAPGVGVVIAGALSGVGRFAVVLLVVMGAWRLAANYVAVREVVVTSPVRAAAWLALGLVGGLGLMAAGTAMLNHISSS